MKIKIILLTLVLCSLSYGITAFDIKWGTDLNSNMRSNTLKQWTEGIEGRIASLPGTGSIFYVDSGVTTEGDGSSWTNARNTLDEAIGLCTADRGDIIYVAQGHNEAWTTTDSADCDVSGITIIGCGSGSLMPRFDYDDTDPELVLGAANVYIYNLAFLPSTSATVHAIEVEADANDSVIDSCWFMNGELSGTDEFIDAVQPATRTDTITVKNCLFESWGGAGANTAIDLTAGVNTDWVITNNTFIGDWAEAPIYSDADVDLRHLIAYNTIWNANSGEYAIEFGGNATGMIIGNNIYTDSVATAIDPGNMFCIENYATDTTSDLSGIRVPPLPAIGTVTAGSADDILKKMYYGADGTGAYPATVANDSTLAKIMAKGSTATASTFNNTTDSLEAIADAIGALGVADEGTYADKVQESMDANSTQLVYLDHLISVLDTADADMLNVAKDSIIAKLAAKGAEADPNTFNNTTDSLEALSGYINNVMADSNAILIDTIQLDVDVNDIEEDTAAILVDSAAIDYWQERTTKVTVTGLTNGEDHLFDVDGGPILITNFVGIVATAIDSNAATCGIEIDRDDSAADTEFTTLVNIESDVVGTVYVFTDVAIPVLTPLVPGAVGSNTLMSPWFCPEGMIEQANSAANLTGTIIWYMTWKPLTTGVSVTAQ